MNRKSASNLAMGLVSVAATLSAAVVTSANAAGDDPAVTEPAFASSLTREQVSAEVGKPYPGGNPWSGFYNMFQAKSATTADQTRDAYLSSREEVRAVTSEDSGSAFIMKSGVQPATNSSAMGAPAR